MAQHRSQPERSFASVYHAVVSHHSTTLPCPLRAHLVIMPTSRSGMGPRSGRNGWSVLSAGPAARGHHCHQIASYAATLIGGAHPATNRCQLPVWTATLGRCRPSAAVHSPSAARPQPVHSPPTGHGGQTVDRDSVPTVARRSVGYHALFHGSVDPSNRPQRAQSYYTAKWHSEASARALRGLQYCRHVEGTEYYPTYLWNTLRASVLIAK